ncbi:hypothetical protein [Peribacillus simplex]|nr:hypothetical protein [Peribacillus simplex]
MLDASNVGRFIIEETRIKNTFTSNIKARIDDRRTCLGVFLYSLTKWPLEEKVSFFIRIFFCELNVDFKEK